MAKSSMNSVSLSVSNLRPVNYVLIFDENEKLFVFDIRNNIIMTEPWRSVVAVHYKEFYAIPLETEINIESCSGSLVMVAIWRGFVDKKYLVKRRLSGSKRQHFEPDFNDLSDITENALRIEFGLHTQYCNRSYAFLNYSKEFGLYWDSYTNNTKTKLKACVVFPFGHDVIGYPVGYSATEGTLCMDILSYDIFTDIKINLINGQIL